MLLESFSVIDIYASCAMLIRVLPDNQVCSRNMNSSFSSALGIPLNCMDIPLLVYPYARLKTFGCFQFSMIMNKVAMNTFAGFIVDICFQIS